MSIRFRFVTVLAAIVLALAPSTKADEENGKGNLRYTITVSSFENKANFSHSSYSWGQVTEAWSEMMTHALNESGRFIVIAEADMQDAAMDEQDFADSDRTVKGKKNPKKGRMALAQILVKGVVTHFAHNTSGASGGVKLGGVRVGGKANNAQINMLLQMVDSSTGIVTASSTIKGKSGNKGISLSGLPLDGTLGAFQKDNVGQAVQNAVDRSVKYLVEQLDDVIWEGTVVVARENRVTINRGEREGVAVGQVFVVGEAEEIVDPDTGEVLDVDMIEIGRLEVTEVKEKIAHCKPLPGAGEIARGMTIMPADDS